MVTSGAPFLISDRPGMWTTDMSAVDEIQETMRSVFVDFCVPDVRWPPQMGVVEAIHVFMPQPDKVMVDAARLVDTAYAAAPAQRAQPSAGGMNDADMGYDEDEIINSGHPSRRPSRHQYVNDDDDDDADGRWPMDCVS